jgi:Fic family protein
VDDLVQAYEFAQENRINQESILKSHSILSRNFVKENYQGSYRDLPAKVVNCKTGEVVYKAAPVEIISQKMEKLCQDIFALVNEALTIDQVLYFAVFIHLVTAQIHPFADGNGRLARLLEKWFLAEKLGKNAWLIESEKNYYRKRISYYRNIDCGPDYQNIDQDLALEFLLMLPCSLKLKKQ